MFLYRHYLELRLKELNETGHEFLGKKESPPGGHSLLNLWAATNRIFVELWPEGPREQLRALETVIREFDELDPNSEAFRYPRDKKGNSTVESLRHLNLKLVTDAIGRAANLLDSASTGLNEYLSQKRDFDNEARNEFEDDSDCEGDSD